MDGIFVLGGFIKVSEELLSYKAEVALVELHMEYRIFNLCHLQSMTLPKVISDIENNVGL